MLRDDSKLHDARCRLLEPLFMRRFVRDRLVGDLFQQLGRTDEDFLEAGSFIDDVLELGKPAFYFIQKIQFAVC